MRCLHQEGDRGGPWILEDFGDVVLHVFRDTHRQFYDLETLFADAPEVKWQKASRPKANGASKKARSAAGE